MANPIAAAEEANAKERKVVEEWLASNCLTDLTLMRFVLHCIEPLDEVGIKMAGDDWEKRQKGLVAQALQKGASYEAAAASRPYRVTHAANGVAENKVFSRLRHLFTEVAMWSLMSRDSLNEKTVAKAFTLLSQVGALTEELGAKGNRRLDVQLFKGIADPSILNDMFRKRVKNFCMHGPFGRGFLQKKRRGISDKARGDPHQINLLGNHHSDFNGPSGVRMGMDTPRV